MIIDKLVSNIEFAIRDLRQYLEGGKTEHFYSTSKQKAKRIIKQAKKIKKDGRKKKLHWTQLPENKAKLMRVTRANLKKARKAKRMIK